MIKNRKNIQKFIFNKQSLIFHKNNRNLFSAEQLNKLMQLIEY